MRERVSSLERRTRKEKRERGAGKRTDLHILYPPSPLLETLPVPCHHSRDLVVGFEFRIRTLSVHGSFEAENERKRRRKGVSCESQR